MSFYRPTLSELIARAEADIDARFPGADSRVRRNALNVLARVHAAALHGAYGMIEDASRFLPDVADGARLERWASIYGLVRKPAEAATGSVALTGTNGTVATAGSVLVRADGERYVIASDATIASGVASAEVAAEIASTAAAMVTGQELTFLSPIAGIGATAIVEAPGIGGGVDLETDAGLRARLLARIQAPVRGGAASDYRYWATEVPEVTRAWVYENWDGLGTVKLLFVCDGRADIIPGSGDIAAVEAWIAPRRPVCADVTVAAPIADAIAFDITLTPATDAVKAAVEAALRDLIAREAEPGGTLLISHIREAISTAAGETDHVLNTPSANVTAAAGHMSTFGSVSW
ncbi:baseplate J/gp47 family protein [Sphingomonas hengshuiensis]|uniref:Baseplate J protein n=1 Tax=Sphingomonas hengshuiensis TaxID=1609977 RepID=A0A7U4JAD8_9SPHN|nr:baseplate J/gp47 family protein [Sphingomonas hengshuiensis]AJP73173.1 hypothetical protein TS85_17325 [Sphingomonas hengshuiensis]